MKALTLTQPWATLVAIGAKCIETRSWSTKYRGPLAIHAAKNFPQDAADLCQKNPFFDALFGDYGVIRRDEFDTNEAEIDVASLPVGSVIATCELVGIDKFGPWINEHHPMLWGKGQHIFELTDQERAFGNFDMGRYGWFLANIKLLPEPIPVKGALGLWEWRE